MAISQSLQDEQIGALEGAYQDLVVRRDPSKMTWLSEKGLTFIKQGPRDARDHYEDVWHYRDRTVLVARTDGGPLATLYPNDALTVSERGREFDSLLTELAQR